MKDGAPNEIVLVFGGARSGKSSWALKYVEERYSSRLFLATARSLDEETALRIRRHQAERGKGWGLLEEPLDVPGALEATGGARAVLVDCLAVWLSNVMVEQGEEAAGASRDRLLKTLSEPPCSVVMVSNEVGMGIVPESKLGRAFRDEAGLLNQQVAARADRVVLLAAGIPLWLKGSEPEPRIEEAPAPEITPEMAPEEIWDVLEAMESETEFVERFNGLDLDTRLRVADHVLSSRSVFSGKPAFFSKHYDAESAFLSP